MIVAGEASADLHAAALVAKLKQLDPALEVYGVGGERLKQEGAKIWFDFSRMGVVGILEVFPKLKYFLAARKRLAQSIATEKPALVILLDLPDFNLSLAKKIKARHPSSKIVYSISPQVWAWRRGRVKTIKKYIDRMLVIFPFEKTFYEDAGVPVNFVGHPLVERMKAGNSREQLRKDFGMKPDQFLLAFLPGSRREELRLYMPPALAALEKLQKEYPLRVLMALAPTLKEELARSYLNRSQAKVELVSGKTYDLLFAADLGLIGSGTATLEAALAGLPMVILARSSWINYFLARPFVHAEFYGLPNLVAQKAIAPELYMWQGTPERIYRELKKLLDSAALRDQARAELELIKKNLGEKEASKEAASIIMELIRG